MKEYVLGFAFDIKALNPAILQSEPSVALIRKNRPTWQSGLLNGVGGKIEKNETEVQAMEREFFEEAGIIFPQKSWQLFARMSGGTPLINRWRVTVFCLASNSIYDVRSITDEKVSTFQLKHLDRALCVPNLRWLLPMAINYLNRKDTQQFCIDTL